MDLNPDKTKVLIIGKSKFNFDYTLQGTAIEILSHIKDIGVTMESNLNLQSTVTIWSIRPTSLFVTYSIRLKNMIIFST